MTSDYRWDSSDIQLPHHSLVIGYLKCNHPEKCTDNSEYDIPIGSISNIYTARLAEGLSYEAATVSAITTKKRHSKVDDKTLAQICTIHLGPEKIPSILQHRMELDTMSTHLPIGIRRI